MFDISRSPKEDYMEEIDLVDNIQAILIISAIESRAAIPTEPV